MDYLVNYLGLEPDSYHPFRAPLDPRLIRLRPFLRLAVKNSKPLSKLSWRKFLQVSTRRPETRSKLNSNKLVMRFEIRSPTFCRHLA